MKLTRTATNYQRELRLLADSLPFSALNLPEFSRKNYKPIPVRQPRTFHAHDSSMQTIGRFLVERGTVELLQPEDTLNLFREIHWCVHSIRQMSRKRFKTARDWRRTLIRARSLVSEIEAAEEELFIANRRLIVSCVKPYFWIGQVWLADFFQEGSKALSNAIRKFDFTRGTPFYVYSQKAIQNRLRNFFRDHIRAGSIGVRPTREMLMIKEILDTWSTDRRDKPDIAVLARLTGLPDKQIEKILPFIRQWENAPTALLSLDAEVGDNNANLYDFIEDSQAEQASATTQKSEIWAAVDHLTPRARFIMRLRFIEGRTLEETGAALGLTRARVKQIQDDALRKLRQMLRRGVLNPNM